MEFVVSDVGNTKFIIELLLEDQIGLAKPPFPKMSKSGVGVCTYYMKKCCTLGSRCPLRHIKSDRTIVCKHWLRGLCKKGDDCEFLHEYNMDKMPECYFYSKYGECLNKECPFLHIDPLSKVQDCLWYNRGFCRNGPLCRNRHVRKLNCTNFINGFCPKGKECSNSHPKWWPLPLHEHSLQSKQRWICHNCKERGHKIQFCLKLSLAKRLQIQHELNMRYSKHRFRIYHQNGKPVVFHNYRQKPYNRWGNYQPSFVAKPLETVLCFKCGQRGHYANRCNQGFYGYYAYYCKTAANLSYFPNQ